MDKARLIFIENGSKTEYDVSVGESVLSALRMCNITAYAPCGGNGTCGKCKMKISGNVSAICDDEIKKLTADEISSGVRLACYATVLGDVTVERESGKMHVETLGVMGDIELSPLKDGELGVAVDIGTTTVAVYVCDLKRGKVLKTAAFANPQSAYGADVISRTDKIMKDAAALNMQREILINAINSAVVGICTDLHKCIKNVCACVLCGNTIMEHIAFGIDPTPISRAPFIAPTLFENAYFAPSSIGLDFRDNAVCLLAPCFASYVGGDIACGMLATELDKCNDNVIFLDVGTNGEIGLSVGGKLYFCSAAAGPAFEGANISCGCSGIDGAIRAVGYDEKVTVSTIGEMPPVGICGSGLIDAVAVMLKLGIIDETGAFTDEYDDSVSALVRETDDGESFFLSGNVYISEKDIREVQLAKSAICAGIYTLLHNAKIDIKDIDRLVLAGGFGSRINADSACDIGLVPGELRCKIVSAGNTAGMGAVALLLSHNVRERAKHICKEYEYIELSSNAFFMNNYIEQMMFPFDE